jgi:hypothetical protein
MLDFVLVEEPFNSVRWHFLFRWIIPFLRARTYKCVCNYLFLVYMALVILSSTIAAAANEYP